MAQRFGNGFPWRFVFTNIPTPGSAGATGGHTTTWADGLLTERLILRTLNQPATISAAVWPDEPTVNALFGDGFPNVSQSNRIIYGLRREGLRTVGSSVLGPWWCRAAGILMSPEDQGDADVPLTHLVAYDAWEYLRGRPVMNDAGELPPPEGYRFFEVVGGELVFQRGDQIITAILKSTIENEGFAFVDAGVAHGGTEFYSGTIEQTARIDFTASSGMMVADAWTALTDTGNCDIVLTPIYDPVNRPGYTHELNVYRFAGENRPSAVFAWDKLMRSVTLIDRQHSGTPGDFFDKIQYYAGQGGFPIPSDGPLTNEAAIAAFTSYWSSQMFPTQPATSTDAVLALARQALTLAKQGKRTVVVTPTPERSPIPFIDYDVGDLVPIYATKRLRVPMTASFAATPPAAQRVQSIPITIDDDGIEHVDGLLVSPDYRDPATPS